MGSRTPIGGLLMGRAKEVHGKYLSCCRLEEEGDFVVSEEGGKVQERLGVNIGFPRRFLSPH